MMSSFTKIKLTREQWTWIGVGAALVGLIALISSLPAPKSTPPQVSAPTPGPATGGAPRLSVPQQQELVIPQSFYALVKSVSEESIKVAILDSKEGAAPFERPGQLSVGLSAPTEYFFQKETVVDGKPYFVPQRADQKQLAVGQYAFIEMNTGGESAVRITFSDKSPF